MTQAIRGFEADREVAGGKWPVRARRPLNAFSRTVPTIWIDVGILIDLVMLRIIFDVDSLARPDGKPPQVLQG
jgi:hypothetical protein